MILRLDLIMGVKLLGEDKRNMSIESTDLEISMDYFNEGMSLEKRTQRENCLIEKYMKIRHYDKIKKFEL